MTQPESRIVRRIKRYLAECKIFHFKVWGSERMMAGLPDIICCYRGRFIGFEVKTAVGSTSARQEYVHGLIRQSDGIAAVVRDVDDVRAVLRSIDDDDNDDDDDV